MASSASIAAQIISGGNGLQYEVFGLMAQTFFFGVYSVLIVSSTRMLLNRGLKTRTNRVMFIVTLFMYILSTAYWAYSVSDVVNRIKTYITNVLNPADFSSNHTVITKWSPLFNAVVLVNYVFADAIVVWRSWIISWRPYRKYLSVTFFFLGVTTVTVTSTIVFRIIGLVQYPYISIPNDSYLVKGVDILQISNLGMSLLSNLSATAVVGATALRHRKSLRAAFAANKNKTTKADRIMTSLVESGVFYCFSGFTVLICSLIRLPEGTLGDLYTPVNIQIAGAYPPFVLLLVSAQKSSLGETTFLNTNTHNDSTPSRPIRFAPSNSTVIGSQSRTREVGIRFAQNPDLTISGTDSDVELVLHDSIAAGVEEVMYDNSHEKV